MKTTDRFSIHFKIRSERSKNGIAPVTMGLVVNGQKSYMSLKNLQVNVNQWDSSRGTCKADSKQGREINNYLDDLRIKMKAHYRELEIGEKPITINTLKEAFLGTVQEEEKIGFPKLFAYHNEQGKTLLAKGTLSHYFVTQRYLLKFIRDTYNSEDISLTDLSYKFIADFETFLFNHEPKDHQKRMQNNGVVKHMVRLKKMINLAVKLEWLSKNPFNAYTLARKKVDKEFLDKWELNLIEEKIFKIERLNLVRDMFVFSCYTGLSYIDLRNMEWKNIVRGIDGDFWLKTSRQKTNTEINLPILPKALEIINKYKNNIRAEASMTLFPVISNQKTNSYLKEIAELCEVKKNLTFHIARHTFATTVTLSNGVPIETVSKILGHTKISTTQIYARVLERKISEDMANLKGKLEKI